MPLENYTHIASIIRMAHNTSIKPQSVNVCVAKMTHISSFLNSEFLQVSAVDSGYINSVAGLSVSN